MIKYPVYHSKKMTQHHLTRRMNACHGSLLLFIHVHSPWTMPIRYSILDTLLLSIFLDEIFTANNLHVTI